MTKIEVLLPDSATEFVHQQVAQGSFSTPSEYLNFLIEQARATAAKERLDELLTEGLESGPPILFSDAWWRNRKAGLLATLP